MLAGEQKLESLYDLDICIIGDENKMYWEKETQLATEYSDELGNQEPLLAHIGFSYFVEHLATVLQCDHCCGCASMIHSFVGFIWLSASYSFLKWCGVPIGVCMSNTDGHVWQ